MKKRNQRWFWCAVILLAIMILVFDGFIPAYRQYQENKIVHGLLQKEQSKLMQRLSEKKQYVQQISQLNQVLGALWKPKQVDLFLAESIRHYELTLKQLNHNTHTAHHRLVRLQGRLKVFVAWFFSIFAHWQGITLLSLDLLCDENFSCQYQLDLLCQNG